MRLANAQAGARPRLGFAGLGWIGAQRMKAVSESSSADIVAVCDPAPQALVGACASLPEQPAVCGGFDELIAQPLDGVVIATPNALHEPQAAAAMEAGLAVFSQKPLALSLRGTARLLALARQKNLPLGIDWSYRYVAGVTELKKRLQRGDLGRITAAELCFHNAYGPDAAWYYEPAHAGGGCLLDLGCHLLDLCHWLLGAREPDYVRGHCFRQGRRLEPPVTEPEDFVMAEVEYSGGLHVHLSCSWRSSAGRGAIIGCRIFGTQGGAEIRNVNRSFYDFEVAVHHGAERSLLASPPDAWPGRALLAWAERLHRHDGCNEDIEHAATTADVIDRIYGRSNRE